MPLNPGFEKLVSKYEPRLNKALMDAFGKIKNQHSIDVLEEAISRGGLSAVQPLFNNMETIIGGDLTAELNNAIQESGRATIAVTPKNVASPDYAYNLIDSGTIRQVQQHNAKLVREIAEVTRSGITENVVTNTIAGMNPRAAARDLRSAIGLTQKQEQAVQNFRNYLQEGNYHKALNYKLRDKRFDSVIKKAIRQNKTIPQSSIDKMTTRYRERFLKYRSEVIARTEAQRGIAMGEHDSLMDAYSKGHLNEGTRKFWIYTHDERTRDSHIQIPELNPEGRRIDEYFETPLGPLMYPLDPMGTPENTIQCRCTLEYRIVQEQGEKPKKVKPVVPKKPKKSVKPKPVSKPKPKPVKPKPKPATPTVPKPKPVPTPSPKPTIDLTGTNNVGIPKADMYNKGRLQNLDVERGLNGLDPPLQVKKITAERYIETVDSIYIRFPELDKYVSKKYRVTKLLVEERPDKVRGMYYPSVSPMKGYGTDSPISLSFGDMPNTSLSQSSITIGPIPWTTGNSSGMACAHEHGHHIEYVLRNKANAKKVVARAGKRWIELYDDLGGSDFFKNNVSRYAGTNEREAFAESFAAFVNPNYGTSPAATLPSPVHDWFTKVFGKPKKVKTTKMVFKKLGKPSR